EARQQVLAGDPFTVGARPHVVARLRRNDELVAVRREIKTEHLAEHLLRRTVGRPVVVCQVEVCDPRIERTAENRAGRLERALVTEVLPEAEADRGQFQAASPAAAVRHLLVTAGSGSEAHGRSHTRSSRYVPRFSAVEGRSGS